MIKLIYNKPKKGKKISSRPTPWHYNLKNFPAFRGGGGNHSAIQPVAQGYQPKWEDAVPTPYHDCERFALDTNNTRIIITKKDTLLLVPCSKEEDEQIMLLTLLSGFRWTYVSIVAVDAEILSKWDGKYHGRHTVHMVVRLIKPTGYIYAETGRPCSSYKIAEVFSWNDYQSMLT